MPMTRPPGRTPNLTESMTIIGASLRRSRIGGNSRRSGGAEHGHFPDAID